MLWGRPYPQVLQADGGTRCACLNAAFLALAHAGVPMRDMLGSCAAGYLESTPLLDLNYLEDSGEGGFDSFVTWRGTVAAALAAGRRAWCVCWLALYAERRTP